MEGRVLRFVAPRRVEIHRVDVPPPRPGEVLVRTRWSGISGGTEMLAYRGELDAATDRDETIQSLNGSFEYPFSYGYSCVGVIQESSAHGLEDGQTVFAFHPHQDVFTASTHDVVPLDRVDMRTATLFPLVETALQVNLDAGLMSEEPVAVLGLGPVGILTAVMLQRSGAHVLGVDRRDDRRQTAELIGLRTVDPEELRAAVTEWTSGAGVPLVVEATGQPGPLALALEVLAHEGTVLVCSWYGTKEVSLPLGREFHRRRLQIRSTQVSTIPSRLAARWDVARRRRTAAGLMNDLPLKALSTHDVPFTRAADAYAALDRGDTGVMHLALRF